MGNRITRKELFRQVDEGLDPSSKMAKWRDPIWLLGAVIMLRDVTKEDAPFVAYLHETEDEKCDRYRHGGESP
jgi:hypothetical protein